MISQDGHKIILASNGAEIMSYLDRKDVDLCFLQDELPDESWLEVCRAYATSAAVEHIPIVIFHAKRN